MGEGPYRPARELQRAIDRGDLGAAVAVAKDWASEKARPIPASDALRLLALVATESPDTFDTWALRWLERWCRELRGQATIDHAVDIAQALATLPVEPDAGLEAVRRICSVDLGLLSWPRHLTLTQPSALP